MVYEGRLHPAQGNERQLLHVPTGTAWLSKNAGILLSPVDHDGNSQCSAEEVERVVAIVKELLRCQLSEKKGKPRALELNDILIVAPYNMQVRRLQEALPQAARVGSVDKFQGQQAAVVIVSMCSSFGEPGPRGLSFLLDRNRLNVALSRATTLAIVVGDPRIANTPADSVADMERINLYCRLARDGQS
jgi:superfamily I DNA and/or RNA helicase